MITFKSTTSCFKIEIEFGSFISLDNVNKVHLHFTCCHSQYTAKMAEQSG